VSPAWRRATVDDAPGLRDLERAANLVALAHVFPPDRHAFPDEEVLRRWRATLVEPGVTVEVVDDASAAARGPLLAYAAYDVTTLRHLAVHPDAWGEGLARVGVERAVAAARAAGAQRLVLWCLRENTRARGLYEHLGWRPSGTVRAARWPPHPEELEHELVLGSRHG
jgi:GNAT superfamily N-acetyltransferase